MGGGFVGRWGCVLVWDGRLVDPSRQVVSLMVIITLFTYIRPGVLQERRRVEIWMLLSSPHGVALYAACGCAYRCKECIMVVVGGGGGDDDDGVWIFLSLFFLFFSFLSFSSFLLGFPSSHGWDGMGWDGMG